MTKETMLSILQQLGYLTQQFDRTENIPFEEAWQTLSYMERVTLKNLSTFLVAIDKIYISKWTQSSEKVEKRKFGAIGQDGVFTLSGDLEVSQLY